MIDKITCKGKVGEGFISLKNDSLIEITQGASGSPLFDEMNELIGMVHSISGKSEAYLIPASTILAKLNLLLEDDNHD